MVGQTIGKYRVVSRLGRGGMGTVYKAVDETLDREVAIKCLNPDLGDPEILKRFRAEALALARLNHPNIATLFELTEHKGELLMVMEFLRGETFDSLSQRIGPLPVDRAAQMCSQVLDALGHAHHAGVVHRDLKPANLMLTESGQTKVMDFGLARMAGTEHLTNDGFMVGTPAYMAPEQVLGREIDGRADLYAIGVVLFRLLTGQLPFKAESGIAMVHRQLHDAPTPIRQLRMELPGVCEEILDRALAKAPKDRFQTAEDFRTALVELGAPLSGMTAFPSPPLSGSALQAADQMTLPMTPSPLAQPQPSAESDERSAPTLMIPSPRRGNMAATAVIGVLLLAGVPTAVAIWQGRPHTTVASAPGGSVLTPTGSPPSEEPVAAAAPAAASGKNDVPAARPETPLAKGASPDAVAPAEVALPRAALPVVTFARLKLLVIDGAKSRDRDATLRLGADGLEILDQGKTIENALYQDVIGLFHSHSREPRWTMSDGAVVPVAKTTTRFSFLKGMPDWITIRTRRAFIPLRVQADAVARLIAELEARTGTKTVATP
jgi:serine/threonine protein kinase